MSEITRNDESEVFFPKNETPISAERQEIKVGNVVFRKERIETLRDDNAVITRSRESLPSDDHGRTLMKPDDVIFVTCCSQTIHRENTIVCESCKRNVCGDHYYPESKNCYKCSNGGLFAELIGTLVVGILEFTIQLIKLILEYTWKFIYFITPIICEYVYKFFVFITPIIIDLAKAFWNWFCEAVKNVWEYVTEKFK